jgi:hypothetical protein
MERNGRFLRCATKTCNVGGTNSQLGSWDRGLEKERLITYLKLQNTIGKGT